MLTKGDVFDVTAHNSFAQLLPAFALSMVAVGLSAPAAMSANQFVVSAVAIGFQLAMVWLVFRLNRQHFAKAPVGEAVPVE